MAVTIHRSFTVPAPLETVGAVLCSEAYSIEGAEIREDVASASYHPLRDDERAFEYEVRYVEYNRTRLGKVDRSGTHAARTRSVWDRVAKTLRWVYSTESHRRFKLEGTYRLAPAGDDTSVDYTLEIDIQIPVIGNQVAKAVAKGFEADLPRLQALLTEHATR